MRDWLIGHRRSSGIVSGIVVGTILFLIGGGFATGWINLTLAASMGAVWTFGWLRGMRVFPPLFPPKPPTKPPDSD
jgi:hypothetical protein